MGVEIRTGGRPRAAGALPVQMLKRVVQALPELWALRQGSGHHLTADKAYAAREELVCLALTVEARLKTLRPADRALLVALCCQGLSETVAAQRLGVSRGALQRRLNGIYRHLGGGCPG